MIKKIDKRNENLTNFEKRYLQPFMEAPEDDDVKKVGDVITSRTKLIDASNREDLGDDVAMDDEDTTLEDLEGLENVDMNDDEDTEDDEIATDDGEESEGTSGEENNDNEPTYPNENENSNDGSVEETTSQDSGDNEIATDDGGDEENNDAPADDNGDEIATDDGDDDTADAAPADGNDETNADNQNTDTQDDDEAIHKQNLYTRFMSLHESIDRYIHKLDTLTGIDDTMNHQITIINDKFKKLEELLYQYMIVKFKKNSYVESMLFYQRTVAAVNLSLDVLSNVWVDPENTSNSND